MTYYKIEVEYIRYMRFKRMMRKYLNEISIHNKKITQPTPTKQPTTPISSQTIMDEYNSYVNECQRLHDEYLNEYNGQLLDLKNKNVLNAILDDCFKSIKLSHDYGFNDRNYIFKTFELKNDISHILQDCGFLVSNVDEYTVKIDW